MQRVYARYGPFIRYEAEGIPVAISTQNPGIKALHVVLKWPDPLQNLMGMLDGSDSRFHQRQMCDMAEGRGNDRQESLYKAQGIAGPSITSRWVRTAYKDNVNITESEGNLITTVTAHIHLDERGIAWIDDTNTKVVEVVLDKLAYGWNPEEIHTQHAHLSLAQIHAALSYYYDHQQAIDDYIEHQRQWVKTMAARAEDSPVRQRLRTAGKLP